MKQITQKKGGCDFVVICSEGGGGGGLEHRERDDAMRSEYHMR